MSQKNIKLRSHQAKSHDEEKIASSQHSKIKKGMADQLRQEINDLLHKQAKAEAETLRSYELYEVWKNKKNEAETEFHYGCYRTWSSQLHRLGKEIQVKLKAVQKYESPKKVEEPKIIDTKKQEMNYCASEKKE